MPTENRSSNTEMVSVPRALVNVAVNGYVQEQGHALNELRQLLIDTPPTGATHRYPSPELVNSTRQWRRMVDGQWCEYLNGEWAPLDFAMVENYLPIEKQNQDEPVAITDDMHRLMEAYRLGEFTAEGGSDTIEALAVASFDTVADRGHDADSYMAGFCASLYWQAAPFIGLAIKPSTHADPGEVERLRAALAENKKAYSELEAQVAEGFKHIDDLRAQLAERNALLEDWHTANCTGEVNVSDKAYRIVTRTAAMLSANAEPSVSVDSDARSDIAADAAYRNGVMHGYKLAMEGTEADYQTCINSLTGHLRAARAVLSASAEPSAPVEIDERAVTNAFHDWAFYKKGEAIGRMDGQQAALEGFIAGADWQARAALERNPS
ncbi:hypothetical protein QIY50_24955 [Pseudomonas putida]|nr:hypothetical protein QIY50_24955 [Pseudomonas putida]